jgi:tRNA (guanine10-N2)-dimethyltransferase
MCGTGGVLVEAGLVGASVLGSDAQWKMARGTQRNLRDAFGAGGDFDVVRADATSLPVADGAADAVVFDAPYGRQSKVVGDLRELVTDALAEARRVAPRCVLVADRVWDGAADAAGWTVESRFDHRVHRSLTRHTLVLE